MSDHPSRDGLVGYLAGSLSESEAESIEQHVDVCRECDATIDNLKADSDTVVEQLRGGRPADPFATEPDCQRMLDQVRQAGAASRTPDSSADERLEFLREYQLLEEIGRGGMGTVYRAVHTKLDRPVALKLLPPHRHRDAEAIARFEREMRALGKLVHPNIVHATDAGEFSGRHYLVTELIDGVDLARISSRLGPLNVPEACEVIRQAALGLQHAFERGLVHRDIKPSNLMLARPSHAGPPESGPARPTVKLLDLGLVLHEESLPDRNEDLTTIGQVMGTIDYMAPEQGSDTHLVDIRADIYSLGATLYKLLTGRPPLGRPEYDTALKKLAALVAERPQPVRELRPDLPESLARTVDRMLAKRPEDRPATPAEVVSLIKPHADGADLAELLDTYGQARPIRGKTTVATRSGRRAPSWRMGLATLLAVGSTVFALALLSKVPSDPLQEKAQAPRTVARSADREVIDWVRSLGGIVGGGNAKTGYIIIGPSQAIPEPFDLVTLNVNEKQVTDRDLARLDGLPHFTTLIANENPITDAGVANLGDLPNLAGVFLTGTNVGDASVVKLSQYPKLEALHLTRTRVTDVGVLSIPVHWSMKQLMLDGCAITDAGLRHLTNLNGLEELRVAGTQVTPAGVYRLHAAFPKCTIHAQFGVFPATTRDRAVAEWVHSVRGGVGISHTSLGYLSIGPEDTLPEGVFYLNTLELTWTSVTEDDLSLIDELGQFTTLMVGRRPIGDAGFAQLGRLPNLDKIYVGNSRLGDAGLQGFAKRCPRLLVLHAGGTHVSDAGVPALLGCPELVELHLENSAITDKSIDTFVQLKHLRSLSLGSTQVTRDGIARLRAALPECRISSNYGTLEP